jgi:iron-sulfur cluster assembly accessory protein
MNLSVAPPLQLTEKAARHIRRLAGDAFPLKGLRLSVSSGGCSGRQYELSIAEGQPEDQILEQYGVKLFVDSQGAQYLAGSLIDYHDGLTAAGFRISNPNAKATCGCGTSFET